ncbi:uncharacterized protein [Amphiura filiformis]|uniref:uncharacterized protein n=1 Tax=Amphiura filiformis TaxID=82378 RepID=UPI003B20E387
MPSKKKYNARFPPARIKKIMQTDEDVGKVAAPVPVLISKALEIFLESLIIKSSHQTVARNAKTMTTAHIKQCIQSESTFDFLKDLVENVPDIAQGEEEDGETNHLPSAAASSSSSVASNNRHRPPAAGGERERGFSRSSSTASSSSYSEGQVTKRRRGRPRKERAEDVAGPSRSKNRKIIAQSSEDRTTSEDSDFTDNEDAVKLSVDSNSSMSYSVPALSQSTLSQDSRQRHPHAAGHASHKHLPQQPSFGLPTMPTFQVPTAPSNASTSSSVGMGLYQMPTASNAGNNYDDDEDDYDT